MYYCTIAMHCDLTQTTSFKSLNYLIGKLDYVSLQFLAGVVVEGALLVHELHHPDLVPLHIEVAQRCLLRLELDRPLPLYGND